MLNRQEIRGKFMIKNILSSAFIATLFFASNVVVADPADQKETEKNNPQWAQELLVIQSISNWAVGTSGNSPSDEVKEIEGNLKSLRRIIPLGKTVEGTNNRVQIDVGRLVLDSNRMLLVAAEKGKLSLIFGAPVSDETMELAHRNSAYIFESQDKEPTFAKLLSDMSAANKLILETHNIAPLVKQDIFNHQVMQIGKFALLQIPIDQKITETQLAEFLTELKMRPYIALDEERRSEVVEAAVRAAIETKLKEDLDFADQDLKSLTDALMSFENSKKLAFEIISDYKAK